MPISPPTNLFPPGRLLTDPVELIAYEADAGFERATPDAVFLPESAADVSRLVGWTAANGTPLIARGAGTGLAGGAVAAHGGVVVSLTHMNRILELDAHGRTALVEAGAVNLEVDAAVKKVGLYYPPDPSSGRSSAIGGNLGTNAGGPHCFKYGVTTNYIMGVEAVLADGSIVQLGGPVVDAPEYDLRGLVVGGEGTLAIVTKATLRLIANPPGVMTMMVSFASVEQAGQAVSAVIAAGLAPATLELMDQRGMEVIEEFVDAGLPVDAGAALIVEVDGYPASLNTQIEEIADLLADNGGYDIRIAQTEEERQQIWYGRKSAAGALARLATGYYLTDVTVRRSLLGQVLHEVTAICNRFGVETASFFHAGDGNLHPLIPFDVNDPEQKELVHEAAQEIFELCTSLDGTITGEHGVGLEKRNYLPLMFSGAELAAMDDVKDVFDPQKLLNPGKVLPDVLPPVERVKPVLPRGAVFAPADAAAAAAGLLGCTVGRRTVAISGAPEAPAWPEHRADIWLSTANLGGVKTFAPEDLYVTAGAGMTLADLQAYLAPHGLHVPLDSPWPDATLGGLLAANVNAPLRMRYGAARDVTLSVTVAMADGRVIRAGRPLVKNVAGYDLTKVFVGSRGDLGLLTDVTLKLNPLPRARRTLAAPVDDLAAGLAWADAALHHALVASAVLLVQDQPVPGLASTPYTLLYTAEGMPEDVDAELAAVAESLRRAGAPLIIETALDGGDVWRDFLARAWSRGDDPALLARMGVPAKDLSAVMTGLPALASQHGRYLVDCASGLVYATHRPAGADEGRLWLRSLREAATERGGYAIALALPRDLAGQVDPLGYEPSAAAVMGRLKQRWDPAGILKLL